MQHTPTRHNRRHAFTIIELLTAVFIASIMLVLINQLFTTTQGAVSRGVALSDIIAGERTVSASLTGDADAMLGPHEGSVPGDESGGILVIVQHRYNNVPFDVPGKADPQGRRVRSDQLTYLARRDAEYYPMSPLNANVLHPDNDRGLARNLRVWLGHTMRLNDDGSTAVGPITSRFEGEAGLEWTLGLQKLLLGEQLPSPNPRNLVLPGPHSNGAWADAPVTSYGSGTLLYSGSTDYAYASLDDPGHSNGCIVSDTGSAAHTLYADTTAQAVDVYRNRAVTDYTFAENRLQYLPLPTSGEPTGLEVAQMHPVLAPHTSDFIVEFAGDYATAPYYGAYGGSVFVPGPNIGAAKNVGNAALTTYRPDGQLDTHAGFAAGLDAFGRDYAAIPAGGIKWYTFAAYANFPGGPNGFDSYAPLTFPVPTTATLGFLDTTVAGTADNLTAAFVWRHDDEDFKLTSTTGPDPTAAGNYGTTIDQNVQSSSWPELLRVRWRMHDPKGNISDGPIADASASGFDEDGDGTADNESDRFYGSAHGMWFEQIIRVNRPSAIPAP